MRRRTGRDSATARTTRKFRKGQLAQKPLLGKRRAVEWLEQRVLLSATPTSIAVSASSSSVVFGQSVALTADVSASPSAPSEGTVVFFDNGTPLGTAPVSSGVATLDNVRLPVGAELITASYSDPGGAFGPSSTAIGPTSTIETVAGGGLQNGLPALDASISPQAVAVDTSGNMFIADGALNVVFEVNHATGVATIVAGNGTPGFSGDGGAATEAELNNPDGVALDSSGDLFIADTGNNRVREVDFASGAITTVAGNGNGFGGFGGDGGPATAAGLFAPAGIAVDSSGDLFIADASYRIRKVDHATGVITTVAGNGTYGFSGDGGPATGAELSQSEGVAVDSSGDLFIADTGNDRVREVDHATGVITTVAGNGTHGFSGDGGPAAAAEIFMVVGVAVDSSRDLYITDGNRVRKVDLATGIITSVAGNGTAAFSGDGGPATAAEISIPRGIAVDTSGNLFIADSNNNRIREVDPTTGIITTVAGNGTQAFSGDGSLATAAEIDSPQSVAVDSSGDLFIADGNRIREVNRATGVITTVAGNGTFGVSGDGGPATAAALAVPQSIAIDSSGDLFIADGWAGRVREVDHSTGVITTVAGGGTTGLGDGGPATAAELGYPIGIAVDSSGNLFIAELGDDRVREVNHTTGVITTVAGNGTAGFSGDGGPATAAELDEPLGIAVDSSGHLFIVDNNRIREVDLATGIITTAAGSGAFGSSGDGGPATAAALLSPTDVAVDSSGNLFIADRGSNLIREVNLATGIITTVAGNGTAGFGGDGGPASAAEFSGPAGVAVDSSGNLFIADKSNNRIREVSSGAGGVGPQSTIETIAGGALQSGLPAVDASVSPQAVAVDSSGNLFIADNALNVVFEVNHTTGVATIVAGNGTAGFSGDGGAATAAELNAPEGVAVDSSGHLFIADTLNNRIREVDLATGVITTVAGNGNGNGGFGGDGGPATAAGVGAPSAIAVDSSGDLFIADWDDNRIRKVNLATGIITTVAGNGTAGFSGDGGQAAAAEIAYPDGLAVDSSGNLFIADRGNNRIREVDHATGVITTVAGGGTAGLGDGGPATTAQLSLPEGIAVDSSGDLFIADYFSARIREVDHATGVITTVAGNGSFGFSGDGGQAIAAETAFPQGVAVDSSGNLFIADSGNHRVRQVDHATGIIATVAGNGTRAFSGDGGVATAAEVDFPRNIAVDSSGDLFIADASNNRIREVNHATGIITTVAGNGTGGFSGDGGLATAAEISNPQGLAVDSSGDLFIVDDGNDRIREVNHATGIITTVAGNGSQGFSGDGGPAITAKLGYVQGIAIDSSGHLFIADTINHRIREVNLATGIIATVAGNGTQGFSGDGGPATAAELNTPADIAVDSSGHLFFADNGNQRIREVDLATGVITTVAGDGKGDFGGDGGPATAAEIEFPTGVAVDSSGHLFIANGYYRIREVDLATGIITTVAGNGAFGFSGDGGPAAAAEIGFAQGVAVDSSGNLFIADGSNNRVREMAKGATAVVNVTQPLVVNDAVYTIGSGVVSVSAADGLLKGDTGPSPLTVTAGTVAGAEGGSFVFHADGSFTYTPGAKFPGFDYAQFTVTSSQGDQGTATVNVLSQAGGVVWKFYEQVLDRAPDYGGLQFWINDLSRGGKPADIAAGFFESDELLDQIVANYYQQYLLRTPDASGLAYWKQVWRESGGPETIKAGFADSPEFYASAGGTAQAWVTELYHRILGRDPDPQGDQYWLNYLTSHGNTAATRYNIALDFFTSLETDKADVTGWFQEYLERAPTASELDQYAGEMQAGKTDRDIEQEIANLPEYGQNPPAAPAGAGVRLPDYFPH